MANLTTKRALQYIAAIKRRDIEYAEECEKYYRQGFRPHYCIHGTDMWTDYDNICGRCEDGYSVYELALMFARADVAEYRRRTAWLKGRPSGSMPGELYGQLINWATSPVVGDIRY